MIREHQSLRQLAIWMQFNDVELHGVAITQGDYGSNVTAVKTLNEQEQLPMRVPCNLVLSSETVWTHAKSDRHLLDVLEAVDPFSRTARGAILIFLLLQLTHNDSHGKIGVSNPFTFYIQALPPEILIPTFWNDSEQQLLEGTSLQAALQAKLASLNREFEHLSASTSSISWCNDHWWTSEGLKLHDWMFVDAAYRSRALEFPNLSHAFVPVLDMANHASGDSTNALYEIDTATGDALLLLRAGAKIEPNSEVTITYGDEKGACEMLFSYGFIEDGASDAKEILLSINIPEDDPLGLAKKSASRVPPGLKLFRSGSAIEWEGPLVWLLCVNEEDGLSFDLVKDHDGSEILLMAFRGHFLDNASALQGLLQAEAIWDVFRLRATTIVQSSIEQQLIKLQNSQEQIQSVQEHGDIRSTVEGYAIELRDLEESFLLEAYEALENTKTLLFDSAAVQKYLDSASDIIPNAATSMVEAGSGPVANG